MTFNSTVARPLIWVELRGNTHPHFYYTLPLTLCIVAIMVASLLPSSEIPKVRVSDKLVHSAMYAGLAWLLLRAWVRDQRPTGAVVLLVVGIAAAWGFYLECLQSLTPDRSFDLIDEAANVLGVVAGVGAWLGWRRVFCRMTGFGS